MACRLLKTAFPWRRRPSIFDEEQSEAFELSKKEASSNEHESVTGCSNELEHNGFNGPKGKRGGISSCYFTRGHHGMSPLSMFSLDCLSNECKHAVKLFQSIHQGNVSAFAETLNELSVDEVNSLSFEGQPLLHLICFKKNIEALKIVFSLNVEVDNVNIDGVTSLHVAVSEGWLEGVEELLSKGASANIYPFLKKGGGWPWREPPIHTAVRNGDILISLLLLEREPDISFIASNGNTLLHLAAFSHSSQLIERLLEEEVVCDMISQANSHGDLPLHVLMFGKNLTNDEEEIVECTNAFLQNGADINCVNVDNMTPLYLACRANLPLVVKDLINAGANPAIITNDGKTVLHAACRGGNDASLLLLMESGRVSDMILQTDNRRLSPFHYAVKSCSSSCCELLLQHGDQLTNVDIHGKTRCTLVLEHLPSAAQLLNRVFDSHITLSNNEADDFDFKIEMDFNVLLSRCTEDVEASIVSDINIDSLLKHPLIESFLFLKWNRIKAFYYIYVLFYFFFLVIHTLYIIKTYEMNTDWSTEKMVLDALHWLHIILLVILILPSTITTFANIKKYGKQWETYFKFVALFTASFVVFARGSTLFSKEVMKNVAAVSIFFAWVEFMMLLGRIPSLGVFIFMFTRVAKSVIRFMLAFSPILIAFALSFSILLDEVTTFQTFPTVFVRTLMMMIGEIEYSTIYENTQTEGTLTKIMSQIYLVVFLVLIPVLMANLLIGLAVSDLPDLQLQGKIRRLVKEASYLESYERLILFFKEVLRLPVICTGTLNGQGSIKRKIVIYPNQRHRKGSVSIPSEAVKGAMISGKREKAKSDNDYSNLDLHASFQKFLREYLQDRVRFEKGLQTIYDVLCQSKPETELGDVVDKKLVPCGKSAAMLRKTSKALFRNKNR